jgi:hypothetical protein
MCSGVRARARPTAPPGRPHDHDNDKGQRTQTQRGAVCAINVADARRDSFVLWPSCSPNWQIWPVASGALVSNRATQLLLSLVAPGRLAGLHSPALVTGAGERPELVLAASSEQTPWTARVWSFTNGQPTTGAGRLLTSPFFVGEAQEPPAAPEACTLWTSRHCMAAGLL